MTVAYAVIESLRSGNQKKKNTRALQNVRSA